LLYLPYYHKTQISPETQINKNTQTYIGVLTQRNLFFTQNDINKSFKFSEVSADIIRWVEQTGAEVVVIPYDMPFKQQRELLSNVNGLILPGGSSRIVKHPLMNHELTDYMKRVKRIIEWAGFRNNVEKKYFALFGICLGYEEMFIT